MSMKRLLGAILATVTAASVTAGVLPSGTSAATSAPTTARVTFGEPVEQSTPDEALRLVFSGRRGQLVTLQTSVEEEYYDGCQSMSLRRGGRKVEQLAAVGVWRLPATGSYEVDYSHTCLEPFSNNPGPYAVTVTLARVEVIPSRPGDKLRLRTRPGLVRAASVRLGKRPLLMNFALVAPLWRRTAEEAGRIEESTCSMGSAGVLSPGLHPRLWHGATCDFRARPGARYLVFGDAEHTRIETFGVSQSRLDGPAVGIDGVPHQVEFRGREGDIVHFEATGLRPELAGGRGIWLEDARTGRQAPVLLRRSHSVAEAWVLRRTGLHRLMVTEHRARPGARLRVRTARVVKARIGRDHAVPVNGTRWTFVAAPQVVNRDGVDGVVVATSGLTDGWSVRMVAKTGWWSELEEIGARGRFPTRRFVGAVVKPGKTMRGSGSLTLRLDLCPFELGVGPVCPTGG